MANDGGLAKQLRSFAAEHVEMLSDIHIPLLNAAVRIELLERELLAAAEMLARSGVIINSIKAYRAATGASLVESKAAMERFKPHAPEPSRLDAIERRVEKLEARI